MGASASSRASAERRAQPHSLGPEPLTICLSNRQVGASWTPPRAPCLADLFSLVSLLFEYSSRLNNLFYPTH